MVYCQKISEDKEKALYKYGPTISKMDGEVYVFHDASYEIKKPSTPAAELYLFRILTRKKDTFKKDSFPERFAYEA